MTLINLNRPYYFSGNLERVQCLLCGKIHYDIGVYRSHFIRYHTVYGLNRRCDVCGQHFTDKSLLIGHTSSGKCPGGPLVYSQKTGEYFYRGIGTNVIVRQPVYPSFGGENRLIGTGRLEDYGRMVSFDTPTIEYNPDKLPLGNLTVESYVVREFCPREPPVPPNSNVVIVSEPLCDRQGLERVRRMYMPDERNNASQSLVRNASASQQSQQRDVMHQSLVENASASRQRDAGRQNIAARQLIDASKPVIGTFGSTHGNILQPTFRGQNAPAIVHQRFIRSKPQRKRKHAGVSSRVTLSIFIHL